MKVILYVVKRNFGWEARISVAWEVDRLYWTDPDYQKRVAMHWGADGEEGALRDFGHGARADVDGYCRNELVWLREPLPLGMAGIACNRLNARWGKDNGRDIHELLPAAALWAAVQSGEPGAVTSGVCHENVMRADGPETATDRDDTLELEDRDALAGLGVHDVYLPKLALQAWKAADRLRGCGLLLGEAMAALDADEAMLLPALQLASLLGGMRLTAAVVPEARSPAALRWRSGSAASMRCRRCGGRETQLRRTPCASCGRQRCAYCEACLTMGRSRECGLLIIGAPASSTSGYKEPSVHVPAKWGLSPAQQEAAEKALAFLLINRKEASSCSLREAERRVLRFMPFSFSETKSTEFLLWAVTGAGKTEMMFPLIDAVLSAGGKVAVATPRRDVVLELAPRLAAAFPHVTRAVLYGGSEDRFQSGDLTLATTHQLIRFKEAFDLVVIDEVDAFPFHNDPALHYAAAEARARSGMTLLLSATPPPAMQRRARRGRLPHARVAVRHHRQPLPVPVRLNVPALSRWVALPAAERDNGRTRAVTGSPQSKSTASSKTDSPQPNRAEHPDHHNHPNHPNRLDRPAGPNRGCLPAKLREAIRASVQRGAQLFMFVPQIRQVEPLVRLLRQFAPEFGVAPSAIDGTSSKDPQRSGKVIGFRERAIRLLVTTTILERGVTVPKSDVFVLDADKPLFDAASLVQMAGRAGRSADDPNGNVYFAAAAWTNAQQSACRQIREMNAYARRKGYLLDTSRQAARRSDP